MALEFRNVCFSPLTDVSFALPAGAIVGVIGEKGCGESATMRLAAGKDQPVSGEVIAAGARRYLGIHDALNLAPVDLLIVDHAFATADALSSRRASVGLDRLRASGATVLLASTDPNLLRALCDEVIWLESGKIALRGDPAEVLAAYNRKVADRFREWGDRLPAALAPTFRKGDGRAEILDIETAGPAGHPAAVLMSGEEAAIRLTIRFQEDVEKPVVGVMIRTRIGLEVYGTNTELEGVALGPCAAGETIRVEFRFRCDLCPKDYTVTAASHDPDGVAHDWMDDAVSFTVADTRSTAGVANLRAQVTASRVEPPAG